MIRASSSVISPRSSFLRSIGTNTDLHHGSSMQLHSSPVLHSSRLGNLPSATIPLVRINKDGSVMRHNMILEDMNKSLMMVDVNGKRKRKIPLRDLRMFWHRPKAKSSYDHLTDIHKELCRPAILPRNQARCYLLDFGALKILCRQDQVDVLYSNESDSRRNTVNHFVEELRRAIADANKLIKTEAHHEPLSFDLLVLETALATTITKLYRQLELVEPLVDGLVTDTLAHPTEIKVARLAALKKSLFSHNQSVQAIIGAIKEVLSNDRDMADMYLTSIGPRDLDDHEEVEYLMEAYVTDLGEIEMKSTGMIAHIEDTMQILELHLNSRRNRIIKLSLVMETLAVATGSGALIGSIFGMNLVSGLENHPTAFYWITGSAATAMIGLLTVLLLRFRHLFLVSPNPESQHSALRNFFSYIDIIEAKVRLTDSISRHEFENIVTSVMGHSVDSKEIDIFFKVLDKNQNTRIDFFELPPLQSSHNNSEKK